MTIREIAKDAVEECRALVIREGVATHAITDEQARDKFLRAFVEMLREEAKRLVAAYCGLRYEDPDAYDALADRIEKEIDG